ncbi:thiamine phosphate synthase [Eubacterium sp. MSJ-13]|nr:thiamine phosphate synthase [Eubacterium sp. MSJ-13]
MFQFSPFLEKISEVVKKKPAFIILREKDLPPGIYKKLAAKVLEICNGAGVPCVLHYFYKEAIELGVKKIHLPLHVLEQMAESEKNYFDIIGVSIHSVEQAKRAEELGASYITAGHVFVTDCKKGLAPRGLGFLKDVCENVDIDVYAIGGISEKNMDDCISAGARGVCMMSGYMK